MKKRYEKLISVLGKNFCENLDFDKTNEIRIVVNKFPLIISGTKRFFLEKNVFSAFDLNEIFSAFCEYSVHAFKNDICNGFITYEGGIRVGICGTAVYSEEKIYTVKDISALNIRIPHEIKGIAEKIYPYAENGGILIIGPPYSGKTTFLRDFVRICSKNFLVTVIDERMEISGTFRGIPSFDIGNAFVLNGYKKSDGIKSAVRSLAPEIIVCDEFGDENDILSALFAMKSGVKIVASSHAYDFEDFITKPFVKKLLELGIFKTFVFLNKNHEISEIRTEKEFFQ